MDYWDAIDYILALPDMERFSTGAAGQTMSLEAMKALLARLGNPHLGRKTIHVTGSKGKGSTSTMITSVLKELGFKTALYTSPHLHDYTERIAMDMLPVSKFDFADGIEEIREAIEHVNNGELGPVSTFGAMTALFFHFCKTNEVDWQVVEVGLGGTHDGTNVFDKKEAAVITAISLEHTQILGDTCEAIAREKAGIITPGTSTILAAQEDAAAAQMVAQIAASRGSKLVDVAKSYKVFPRSHDSNGQSFVIEGPNRRYDLHAMMLGLHQLDNAATAVATIESVLDASDETAWAIEDGISSAEISGRIEQLTRHPLTVIDGAHNRESMDSLLNALERHFDYDHALFIIGSNADKDMEGMLKSIAAQQPKVVIATRSASQKALPPDRIAEIARKLGLEVHVTQNVESAIAVAREFAEHDDLVCITGSLYVVGEARQIILSLPITH